LDELDHMEGVEVMARLDEGLPKLWLIRSALQVRRNVADSFDEKSAYTPLWASGIQADHVVAYQRGHNVVVVVPRLWASLPPASDAEVRWGDWGDTVLALPEGEWRNVLDAEKCVAGQTRMSALFARIPVALLVRKDAP
jgi:(1->4)-alpha-D-glucan 1-alpha-D-glucosylmutase